MREFARTLMVGIAAGLLVFGAPTSAPPVASAAENCVAPPSDRYGVAGPHETAVVTFDHPVTPLQKVSVYSPTGGTGSWPVLFFSHALQAHDPETYYRPLIDRLVSRGAVVVYSPYSTTNAIAAPERAYDELWSGFREAVSRYGQSLDMDLDRVGFLGHSFGGGATPEMFRRGVMEQGWGDHGGFMHIFAPYKNVQTTDEQLAAFPPDTKLLIQVYDDDDTNDHRFAIENIWKRLTSIPARNRDYVLVRSAANGLCSLPADHGVPMTGGGRYGKLDAYDQWAVWRHAAALMACSFDADGLGCAIALGHGSKQQVHMGTWMSDGTPVPSLQSMRDPVPANCGTGEKCTFRYRDIGS